MTTPSVRAFVGLLATTSVLLTGCGDKAGTASPANGAPAASAPSANSSSAPAPAAPRPGDVDGTVAAYLVDMEQLTALFKQVRDAATATKHAPAIKAISVRLNGYADQLKTADPTKKGMAFAAQTQRLMKIQQEMAPELARISRDPALARHLGDAMKLPKVN